MNPRRMLVVAMSAALVVGCVSNPQQGTTTSSQTSSTGNKQAIGTVIGGVLGGLIGTQIGAGKGRTVAIIAGTLLGGFIGNRIGANLDEQDRLALTRQTEYTLAHSPDGRAATWTSTHSGSSARITPVSTTTRPGSTEIQRTAAVQAAPSMQLLNEVYRAKKSAVVRNAPDANADKVGGLTAGSTFTATGVTASNWVAVSRKGVLVGYVSGSLVEPATSTSRVTAAGGTDLDALDVNTSGAKTADTAGFDLDSLPVVKETVTTQTKCRTLRVDLKTQSGSESQTVESCQAADGAWDLG